MNEEFLQFLWKNQLFSKTNKYSTQGHEIEIIDVGKKNLDAGPDFFEAKIKLDGVLWAGNVEMHIKSSSWNKHGHDSDPAYNNVILHVVIEDDQPAKTSNKRPVPCLELDFNPGFQNNYQSLMASQKWIPCSDEIKNVEEFFIKNWMDRMLLERMERKSNEARKIWKQNNLSWEETFYQLLARYFGMKVNADPFQQLARSIPMKFLARQKNSLIQLEALLFGQAGLLGQPCYDPYHQQLAAEYKFLANKYKLNPMSPAQWKWLRLRPANFPTIRIAQFASLVHNSHSLFSKTLAAENYTEMSKLLESEASSYWTNHYQFGVETKSMKKILGKAAIHGIIINSITPVLFHYGKETDSQQMKDKACELLEEIPAEKNSITRKWAECGVETMSAYHTQALLQLKSDYCDNARCLECELGNRIIRMPSTFDKHYKR